MAFRRALDRRGRSVTAANLGLTLCHMGGPGGKPSRAGRFDRPCGPQESCSLVETREVQETLKSRERLWTRSQSASCPSRQSAATQYLSRAGRYVASRSSRRRRRQWRRSPERGRLTSDVAATPRLARFVEGSAVGPLRRAHYDADGVARLPRDADFLPRESPAARAASASTCRSDIHRGRRVPARPYRAVARQHSAVRGRRTAWKGDCGSRDSPILDAGPFPRSLMHR